MKCLPIIYNQLRLEVLIFWETGGIKRWLILKQTMRTLAFPFLEVIFQEFYKADMLFYSLTLSETLFNIFSRYSEFLPPNKRQFGNFRRYQL